MIIDFHTHVFPDALAPRAVSALYEACGRIFTPCTDGTVRSLTQRMDEHGVDISVVQPVITKLSQTKTLNEWAASIASERIISFGGIFPHTDDYKRDIDFVCSLGLRGLKFHAEYQGFSIDDPSMLKIYDYALSRGLIILHHAGYDPAFKPPFRSSPKQFQNIARAMKGGVLVAAHFGGQSQWDDVERYLIGENIYFDTSMGQRYYPTEQFIRIVRAHGAERILFGSDSPWSIAKEEIESINSLPLTDSKKTLIFSENARKILNI